MELSSQMLLFARVVDRGSFSAAARDLSQSPSAVSKQIGALEDRMGLRLLTRTQQGITLTEEGRVFYDRCSDVAETVAETQKMLESMAQNPRGTLRLVSTVAFGKKQVMPLLAEFLEENPDIDVIMELSDRAVDLFVEDVDILIRFSEQIGDSAVIARKLATNKRVLCASPAYLDRHGIPQKPSDLATHNCLRLSKVDAWNEWLVGPKGAEERVSVTGNFEANSADGVYHATMNGLGIARLSTYLVNQDIAEGRLVRLFPDYLHEDSAIFALYPDRRNMPPKVRVFLEFLASRIGKSPPWER